MKIIILTDVVPSPDNKNGPSGLIWHIVDEFIKDGHFVDLKVISNKSKIIRRLSQLCINRKQNHDFLNFDKIIAYPFHVATSIPVEFLPKTIVVGPDSPSLLFNRLKNIDGIYFYEKIKYKILALIFMEIEKYLLRKIKLIAVVGKNDQRWLKFVSKNNYLGKIIYLTHPILTNVVEINKDKFVSKEIDDVEFVFSGNLEKKYVGDFFEKYKKYPIEKKEKRIKITIIGDKDCIIRSFFSNYNNIFDIKWKNWIDNYSEICVPGKFVHCFPLVAGAGTKNRTLTAIASGVNVIGTFIAFENIKYNSPPVKMIKVNSAQDLITKIIEWNSGESCADMNAVNIYKENINIKFSNDLLNLLYLK